MRHSPAGIVPVLAVGCGEEYGQGRLSEGWGEGQVVSLAAHPLQLASAAAVKAWFCQPSLTLH